MNNTDLTFITNLPGQTLKDRFNALIKDTRFFDILVGYFYVSGFYAIYKSLENTEEIRILIGISTTEQTYELIQKGSQKEVKDLVEKEIIKEFEDSEDKKEVDEGILKFVEWISTGKLKIRAYNKRKLHAKLYIMTFKEGDRDAGRVITGSSNFTQKGLVENLEFNVELKNRNDYDYAKKKFEELWENSVEVSEKFVETIKNKTFINDSISPYQLYLKFLYEYFKEELENTQNLDTFNLPENFKNLEYQRQAVLNAKKIIEEHGGVFISDVVGLGKTYMTAMLVSQLGGNTMVIAPPSLLSRSNLGSWENVLRDFHIPFKAISIGKLEEALKEVEFREYKNIIIDESHRFRNESTITYEKLAEICRGKRVILVSATPYNNSPKDILAQIKLFQNPKRSTIPGILDLESFFKKLEDRLEEAKKSQDQEEFIKESKEVAKEIRNKVLKYIMIRRTRKDIESYFKEDLEKNNLKFPQVKDPIPVLYQLNEKEDNAFMETVKLVTKDLTYARYTPLLYLESQINILKQSQKNMASFMKVLLVKRLESSFYAFNKTLDRFIKSYEGMLKAISQKGKVYISKKFSNKILEFLESDNDEEIEKLLNEGKAEEYNIHDFEKNFIEELEKDLYILKQIKSLWQDIERDPKLDVLIQELKNNPILKDKKIIIFTESKETAEYLTENLNKIFDNKVLLFHGGSSEEIRDKIIENFDDRSRVKRDDYRILVTTDVLSEGVNLHRSNIIINYDIPWNPTKIIQRVGRVNRLDTKSDEIHVFNFFPTAQVEDQIKLKQIARSKVEAFLNLLGGDAAILTEGESVKSHELFDKLTSKNFLTDEDFEESELEYYRIIEKIRDKKPDLFCEIKQLPKKARAGKKVENITNALLTFFRKGKLMKFYLSNKNITEELDFLTAVKFFKCDESQQKINILTEEFYSLLEKNKESFKNATTYEEEFVHHKPEKDKSKKLLKYIKAIFNDRKKLTEDQENYIDLITERIEEGALPKKTVQKALKAIKHIQDPLKAISVLKNKIPKNLVYKQHLGMILNLDHKRDVILSLYLGY